MPIHDWTRVDAGLFHAFHVGWIPTLSRALNAGVLPPDYFALPEQSIRGPVPDVLTLQLSARRDESGKANTGLAVAAVPPRARLVRRAEDTIYARKADRIAVRHRHGQVVAVIEIVSPGNKASKGELRSFVEKSSELIHQGIHRRDVSHDLGRLLPRRRQGAAGASGRGFERSLMLGVISRQRHS